MKKGYWVLLALTIIANLWLVFYWLDFQGCGLLGIYGCALLHEAGFSKVFCSDINADRLAMVKKFGGIPLQAGKKTDGTHLVFHYWIGLVKKLAVYNCM